jgi:hypothetical protein
MQRRQDAKNQINHKEHKDHQGSLFHYQLYLTLGAFVFFVVSARSFATQRLCVMLNYYSFTCLAGDLVDVAWHSVTRQSLAEPTNDLPPGCNGYFKVGRARDTIELM